MSDDIAALVSGNLELWTGAIERRSGAGRGNGKKVSLYGIEQLRKLILDLAVRGKLVQQDEADEPAAAALKRVAKARSAKLEARLARKPKSILSLPNNLPKVPDGWAWTQLGIVAEISPGNQASDETEVSFVPMTLVSTKITGEHEAEIRTWGDVRKGFTQFANGDIGLAKITPCFENGKAAIFHNLRNGIGAGTTELHVARPWSDELNRRYLLLTMKTASYLANGEAQMTGTAGQKRLTRSYFEATPLPFPPLAEQRRIVAKVDELMALCDTLEAQSASSLEAHQTLVETLLATLVNATNAAELARQWARLEAHFDTLFATEASVDALQQTVLDLAFNGKFTPSDLWPTEAERLKSAATLQNGYAFKSEWFTKSGIRLLRNINISHGHAVWDDAVHLPTDMVSDYERFELSEGDVVLTLDRPFISTGTKVARITAEDLPALLLQRVGRFQLTERITADYLYLWVRSPMFSGQIDPGRSNGVPHISSKQVEAARIFVPSITEQRRIVAKVDELMHLCASFRARIASSTQTQKQLADAIVERAAA